MSSLLSQTRILLTLLKAKGFPHQEIEKSTIRGIKEIVPKPCGKSTGLLKGEKHALYEDPKCGWIWHNYSGPGTHFSERILDIDPKTGVWKSPPINDIDENSLLHDFHYTIIKELFDRYEEGGQNEDWFSLVQGVDDIYTKNISKTSDQPQLKKIILVLFGLKKRAEKLGIISPLKFIKGGT